MTKARDIADFKFENITDTGTEGTRVATGTNAQRGTTQGQLRFNTDTGLAEYYTGTAFKSIDAPPTVSSIDVTEVDSQAGGNQTIVITGGNFSSGATVTFIGASGTNFNASTVTVDSATQITAVAPKASFLNAQEPYGVKVENTSGLSATLASQINVDTSPSWQTASGTLATILSNATGTHATVSATDPDGDTVSYSETGGTVLSTNNFSLDSSTGAISGDPVDVNASTTHTFTLRATANSKTADRSFNIIVNPLLDGSTQTKANTSASAIKTLTGTTTDGYYWIQASGMANPVQLWCDMNTDGGGYMRFWWFNTLEQDGSLSGSWQTGTKFGIGDISTIPYNQYYGYGRIPSGVTPTKLLVKGTSYSQTSTSPPRYAIWTFNSSNSTSNAMKASMQSGTTYTMSPRDDFPPSSTSLDTDPYGITQSAGNGWVDHWGYGNGIMGGSESTFDLNDDTGRSNTAFGAGYDGAGSGTDFVSGGTVPQRDNATGRYLILYWK